jgi:tetratricopeptide (TPR) repeat protein
VDLYLQRGEMYRMEQHWREALADFDRAQLLDPDNVQAERGRGNTWLDRGDYPRALDYLNRAIASQPGFVRARLARAKAWQMSGEPLAAASEYQQVIGLFVEPADPLPEYYYEHARALQDAGPEYIDAALQTLDEGCARLGNIRVLMDYAIELERSRGNHAAALHRLNRIIDQSPRKESLLLMRGDLLRASGMNRQAEQAYTEALAAIDALPTRHRNSRMMVNLRSEIESRTLSPDQIGTGG